ncbi:unnamed protein product [Owenia fusiformis]|uniref:Uncharacterized protein n=1 Tax=Owenia fusiformis TaxID=6347 RepID=A0A8J1TW37_OWEFU|nr:unnamed protein product [Owenia fusiformis]
MSSANFVVYLMAFICQILMLHIRDVSAGSCWLAVGSNGRCQNLLMTDTTRENCCVGNRGTAWVEEDASSSDLFRWRALTGGAPNCQRCHNSCSTMQCSVGKKCKERNGIPKCVCAPDCHNLRDRHRGPVCGSDNRTYKNQCTMLKHNCRHNNHVEVAYPGECQTSCDTVQCTHNRHCILDQNHIAHCVECSNCPRIRHNSPSRMLLCGSDGNTYNSQCHIRRATCLNQGNIQTAYKGRCQDSPTCDNIQCTSGKSCLMNPTTQRPQCVTCIASMYCGHSQQEIPLCGVDNKTYNNWCALRRASCESGVIIEAKHPGRCEGNTSRRLNSPHRSRQNRRNYAHQT